MVWCCDGYLMAGVWLKEEKSIERDDLFVIEMNLKIIEQRALVYLQQTVINTSSSLLSVSSSSLVLACSRDTPTHTPTHTHKKQIHSLLLWHYLEIEDAPTVPGEQFHIIVGGTSKHRTSIYISHLHDHTFTSPQNVYSFVSLLHCEFLEGRSQVLLTLFIPEPSIL